MTTERERIARHIRALKAKTVENGCTEDEAIAAAEKVAEMLDRYNMTVDEAEMRRSPFERHTETHADAVGERLWKPASAISKLTGTRTWRGQAGVFPYEVNFFGFDHEVQVAAYLLELCAGAMRRQQRRINSEWCLLNAAGLRRKVLPFLDGMADRLYDRILALIPPVPTGTGLIVVRNELIDAAMPVKTTKSNARPSRDLDASYAAGLAAGDLVALNRGVANANKVRFLL